MNKVYQKFHEIENNKYYLLNIEDDIYLATEATLPLKKKFLCFYKNKTISQGLKLLEITPPILMLFQELLNCEVDKKDEEFKDMTTYKKINNKKLRKNIEGTYKNALKDIIDKIEEDFNEFLSDILNKEPNISDEEFTKIEETNRIRCDDLIRTIKDNNPINMVEFRFNTNEDNKVIKRMLNENMEYLYTQKIGSTYKLTYLYDLDIFGTITIYKIHLVKDTIKSIETFIYNREVIEEMTAFMINNDL